MGGKTFSILLLAGMFFLALTAFHIAYPISLKAIDNSSLGLDVKDFNLNDFQTKHPPTIFDNIFRSFKYAFSLTMISVFVFLIFFLRPISQNPYFIKDNWPRIAGFLGVIMIVFFIAFIFCIFRAR